MRIAFVFIAEAYQCYHLAAVALELQQREGVNVDVFYNDPDTPRHLDRIAAAFDVDPLPAKRLRRGWKARLIQLPRLLGLAKKQVLFDNKDQLLGYDMVVSPERIGGRLAMQRGSTGATIVYVSHGPAGRAVASEHLASYFDLILLPGEEDVRRYRAIGCLHEGGYRATGYPKIETVEKLGRHSAPLFASDRPIVLYNPHKIRSQSSWYDCIEPMLHMFAKQEQFNLVVAPHIKLFYRRSRAYRQNWSARSTNHILIDPGSERCLDNSYTAAADIYVGDVSSQISEFLLKPRPCVFLNPHKLKWRGLPDFKFWEMGEVVDDVNDLIPALRRARDQHARYLPAQQAFVSESFRQDIPSAIAFTADTMLEYLRNGRVDP